MKFKFTHTIGLFFVLGIYAQKQVMIDVDAFYGFVIEHDKSLNTAIQGEPFGILLGYNFKNATKRKDLASYNYPDFGFSALYQNTNSRILGEMYGLYSHYNFYLSNRNLKDKLQLRFAVGLGYITNPYDAVTNPFNYTLATKMAGSAYVKLNYQREFLKNKLGFQTGISLIHFSNAGFKNPNLGINSLVATVGFNYNLSNNNLTFPEKIPITKENNKIRYNLLFRAGFNESKIPNSGQFPFYVVTFGLEKRVNYKSTLTAGSDFFKTYFLNKYLQDEIELETGVPNTSKFKTDRIGVFIGHELHIQKVALVTQLGYNVYYPNTYVSRIYERLGLKHQFNDHFFTALTLKVNLFRAEGLEFGLGYRF